MAPPNNGGVIPALIVNGFPMLVPGTSVAPAPFENASVLEAKFP